MKPNCHQDNEKALPLSPTQVGIRLIGVFLLLFCLQVQAKTVAQTLTINEQNASLEKLFKLIEKQSGYSFVYNKLLLQNAQPVTIQGTDMPLKKVLDICFANQSVTYKIDKNNIIVKQKVVGAQLEAALPGDTLIDISGKVTNEKGEPIPGVSITVKNSAKGTSTDDTGNFILKNVSPNAMLQANCINCETLSIQVNNRTFLSFSLKPSIARLEEVAISASTGYQQIPKERITGSFVLIDNKLLNRKVSTNILDRLEGVTSGLNTYNSPLNGTISRMPSTGSTLGLTVRGESTVSFNVNKNPLIIVDNFPYEGDIRNLNPNDIESITVLKDAAAASIWGSRSGNGVIVISTKKAKENQNQQIDFNSNITIGNAPNIYYDKNYINSSDYIDIERYLFSKNFFNSDINNQTSRPALSPVVDILANIRSGNISSDVGEQLLNNLRKNDVRDDYKNFFYQKSLKQQYSFSIRGGSQKNTYVFSVGYDNNKAELKRNGYSRFTLNAINTFKPLKKVDITTFVNYSQNKTLLNNQVGYGTAGSIGVSKYNQIFPYTRLVDETGKALSVVKNYRAKYIDSVERLGFLDWRYRPLDEMNLGDNNTGIQSFLFRTSIKYNILSSFSLEMLYQNEQQKISTRDNRNSKTFYTRNLVNRFTTYDPLTKSFTYNLPKGDLLSLGEFDWNINNFRIQANFNKRFGLHSINSIGGIEIKQLRAKGFTRQSYGYDPNSGTAVMNLNYSTTYPTNPSGSAMLSSLLPTLNGSVQDVLNRYVSYYGNAGYSYNDKYDFTISARKDGANLFGVKTNDKFTPLWSSGIGWTISNENFYKSSILPYLKLRASYGFNGNVYDGPAYTIGYYGVDPVTGARIINPIVPGNNELTWEKVKNINIGIDFSTKSNFLKGTLEVFKKEGKGLVEATTVPEQTGYPTITSNAANTTTKGVDLTLTSNIRIAKVNWSTTLLFSYLTDKLNSYSTSPNAYSFQADPGSLIYIKGKPLYGILSYKWGGLDASNGDPQGYLNGKISKDYSGIIANYNADSLVYHGSGRPKIFGSFRNDFEYRGFTLSVNIIYKLKYFFRRTSISTNYQDLLNSGMNSDYFARWQKPGDEKNTNIPSLSYPSDYNKSLFYQYSEALVEKGDNIRLQDIRFGYSIPTKNGSRIPFKRIEVFTYLSNLGIIWRANKYDIDPDVYTTKTTHNLPNPFSISFGVQASF